MSEISIMMITIAVSAGIILGLIFYGGLWLTITKGLPSKHAHWWFLGSFWLRLGIAFGGFYIVAQGEWENILACLAGFMIGRVAVKMLTRETSHAA
jgi:F1F0 ATPase subunit 2